MALLKFNAAAVKPLIEHAMAAKSHRTEYCGVQMCKGAALMLVGDQGVYLMSNGLPGLPAGKHVVYAEGHNPEQDPDWYEAKRDSFGGDDGVEFIECLAAIRLFIEQGYPHVLVEITEDKVEVINPRTQVDGVRKH